MFPRHLLKAAGASALRFNAYDDPVLMQVTLCYFSAAAAADRFALARLPVFRIHEIRRCQQCESQYKR